LHGDRAGAHRLLICHALRVIEKMRTASRPHRVLALLSGFPQMESIPLSDVTPTLSTPARASFIAFACEDLMTDKWQNYDERPAGRPGKMPAALFIVWKTR
jgi:hypothetical protein